MQQVALIITAYNRPDYVRRCFASLAKADLSKCCIIVVDDGSTEPLPDNIFGDHIIHHKRNAGIKAALYTGVEHAIGLGFERFINLDSDAIVAPDFVGRLLEMEGEITSGFRVASDGDRPNRRSCNGINMCFTLAAYRQHILPALSSTGSNWDFDATKDIEVPIANPGVIQHIGYRSSMGHDGSIPDHSPTLKEFGLPDVTLFGADSRDKDGLLRAATISKMNIAFGAEHIITDPLFSGIEAYSKFCIFDMPDYCETSHMLILHHDGYVLKPEAWQPEWLEYDYIGAPWNWYDKFKVGNGGFCLRSKRLMLAVRNINPDVTHPEDDVICRQLRPKLEAMGMKFAPLEVAERFSIEGWKGEKKYSGQFGFHGPHADLSDLPRFLHFKQKTFRAYDSTKDPKRLFRK